MESFWRLNLSRGKHSCLFFSSSSFPGEEEEKDDAAKKSSNGKRVSRLAGIARGPVNSAKALDTFCEGRAEDAMARREGEREREESFVRLAKLLKMRH